MRKHGIALKASANRICTCLLALCLLAGSLSWPDTSFALCIDGNHGSLKHVDTRVSYEMDYVDENGGHHYGSAPFHIKVQHQQLICRDCGEVVDDDYTYAMDHYDPHTFDDSGVCTLCHYVSKVIPECNHNYDRQQGSYLRSGDPQPDPDNDRCHIIRNYYAVVCSNCGETLEGEMEGEPTYEDHTFSTGGQCIECDYECKHPESEYKTRPLYKDDPVPYDEEQHSIKEYYKIKCGICGFTVAEEQEETTYEEHDFDSNGTCTECGYVKEQNPEELQVSLSVNPTEVEVGGQFIAVVTVSGGSGVASLYWHVTCNGNEKLDITTADQDIDIPAEEAGTYVITVTVLDNNGAQDTDTKTVTAVPPVDCTHEHTETVYTEPGYEQIDGNEEEHNVYKYYDLVCSDCGETVEAHKCDEPEKEAHHFDSNGTCSDCGYVKEQNPEKLLVFVNVNQTTALVGESLDASATATGGDGNYKFAWKITRDGEEIHITDDSIGPIYNWPADVGGTYVFTVIVIDGEQP